ncbi:MAG: hypothetical protein ABIO86_16920 [Sphingomonas sp.]
MTDTSDMRVAEAGMPFREKSAWVAVAGMVVGYGGYFAAIGLSPRAMDGDHPEMMLRLFALLTAATIVRLLIMGAGTLAIRTSSPADARAPADERDRAIAGRSAAIAYYVMMTGMILVGMVMPFTAQGWTIVNAALLAIVVAELARYGTIIAAYRRGWHG